MVSAGVDPVFRNAILGHSQKGMDAYYMRLTDEDLHRAMDRFTEWLDNQAENVTQTVTQEAFTTL